MWLVATTLDRFLDDGMVNVCGFDEQVSPCLYKQAVFPKR